MSDGRAAHVCRRHIKVGSPKLSTRFAKIISMRGPLLGVVCAVCFASCANSSDPVKGVTQTARHYQILLVPSLQGGTMGWCLAVFERPRDGCYATEAARADSPVVTESENCANGNASVIDAYALVGHETRFVSIAGGSPIPTEREPLLPNGLRSVFVEIHYRGQAQNGNVCPRFVPLDGQGKVLRATSGQTKPLARKLPSVVTWRRKGTGPLPPGAHMPLGVCELQPDYLLGYTASSGFVVGHLEASSVPLKRPGFTSCVSTTYTAEGGRTVRVAVLVDAESPGREPSRIPGASSFVGVSRVFRARGAEGEMVMRRVHGAWLVVEAQHGVSINTCVEIMKSLHTITDHL